DDRGDPRGQAPLPGRADHAGGVERVVRPEPGGTGGAELGLPRRVRARRAGLGDRPRVADHADRADRRGPAPRRAPPGLRPAPLARRRERFEGGAAAAVKASRAAELAGLPLWDRLKRRIIDGERSGLEADLDEALGQRPALEIVNDILLDGMKTVGDLFGSGQ